MKNIVCKSAPSAIGPYSQAMVIGKTIYTSGQLGVDANGVFVGSSAAEQAQQSLINLTNVLNEAGYTMNDVVKTVVFLADLNDFVAVNEVYESFFAKPYPARSCVQVAKLPKGALVEIEVIGIKE